MKNDNWILKAILWVVVVFIILGISIYVTKFAIPFFEDLAGKSINQEIEGVTKELKKDNVETVFLLNDSSTGDVFSYLATISTILALIISTIAVIITYYFSKQVQESTEQAKGIASKAYDLAEGQYYQQIFGTSLGVMEKNNSKIKKIDAFFNFNFQSSITDTDFKVKDLVEYLQDSYPEYKNGLASINKYTGWLGAQFVIYEDKVKENLEHSLRELILYLPSLCQTYITKDSIKHLEKCKEFDFRNISFIDIVEFENLYLKNPDKKFRVLIDYVQVRQYILKKLGVTIENEVLTKDVDIKYQFTMYNAKKRFIDNLHQKFLDFMDSSDEMNSYYGLTTYKMLLESEDGTIPRKNRIRFLLHAPNLSKEIEEKNNLLEARAEIERNLEKFIKEMIDKQNLAIKEIIRLTEERMEMQSDEMKKVFREAKSMTGTSLI